MIAMYAPSLLGRLDAGGDHLAKLRREAECGSSAGVSHVGGGSLSATSHFRKAARAEKRKHDMRIGVEGGTKIQLRARLRGYNPR